MIYAAFCLPMSCMDRLLLPMTVAVGLTGADVTSINVVTKGAAKCYVTHAHTHARRHAHRATQEFSAITTSMFFRLRSLLHWLICSGSHAR